MARTRRAAPVGPCLSALVAALVLLVVPPASSRADVITLTSGNNPLTDVIVTPLTGSQSIRVSGYEPGNNYLGEGYNLKSTGNLTTYNGKDFIINKQFGPDRSDRITMELSFPISNISFDYEIFPNGNVPNGTGLDPARTRNWPDFTFKADGNLIFRTLALMPPPNSPSWNNAAEKSPQFIGSSGLITFDSPVTKLEFIDWPPTIGVNNIQFNFPTIQETPVPEPASLAAFSLVLAAGWGVHRLRRRSHAS